MFTNINAKKILRIRCIKPFDLIFFITIKNESITILKQIPMK